MSNVHIPKVWRNSEILCSNIGKKKNKCLTYQMENETKLQNGYFVTLTLLWSAILEAKLMPLRYLLIPDVLTKSNLYSQKRKRKLFASKKDMKGFRNLIMSFADELWLWSPYLKWRYNKCNYSTKLQRFPSKYSIFLRLSS